MEEMLTSGYVLGGEQSGHVILAEHLPTGDGLATALARASRDGRERVGTREPRVGELVTFPQTLVNVRVRERAPVVGRAGHRRRRSRASKRRSTAVAACSCAIRAPSRSCAS